MTTETNMLPLKVTQVRGVVANCIKGRKPVCITGAPGIGKSQIVAAACAEVGARMMVLHPVTSDPTDYKGLPVMTVNGAEFSAYGDLRQIINATDPLAVFFDDLGNAPQSVQSAIMHLPEARQINAHVIPDCVTFIAATNRRTDRTGVAGMIEALKKRFLMLELQPDLLEWQIFAAQRGISNKVIAYLSLVAEEHPEYFLNEETTPDMSVNANPRGWERVSDHMQLGHATDVLPAVFAGLVGKAAGAGFASFLRVYDNMVMPEVVLANPDKAPIPAEPSSLWALCSSLAHKVTPNTVGAYCRYMVRLVGIGKNEYVALSLKTMVARDPSLQATGDYINATCGPLGKLMMGGK